MSDYGLWNLAHEIAYRKNVKDEVVGSKKITRLWPKLHEVVKAEHKN